jgi:hypothetical protein
MAAAARGRPDFASAATPAMMPMEEKPTLSSQGWCPGVQEASGM